MVSLSWATLSTTPETGAVTFQRIVGRVRTILVPGKQGSCLIELMFGRVMEEFGYAQIAIGNPHGEFGPLKRLSG